MKYGMIKTQGSHPSESCGSLLRDFLKLKLGMMQFRAIKILTKKILAWVSLAREKYTVFMKR